MDQACRHGLIDLYVTENNKQECRACNSERSNAAYCASYALYPVCTDADLKFLEDDANNESANSHRHGLLLSPQLVKSVIARLRAAEKALNTAQYVKDSWINLHFGATFNFELDVWRKSKGDNNGQ